MTSLVDSYQVFKEEIIPAMFIIFSGNNRGSDMSLFMLPRYPKPETNSSGKKLHSKRNYILLIFKKSLTPRIHVL